MPDHSSAAAPWALDNFVNERRTHTQPEMFISASRAWSVVGDALGMARQAWMGLAWLRSVQPGKAWHGKARQGWRGIKKAIHAFPSSLCRRSCAFINDSITDKT